ncbi:MOSC domain-containing protein [Streptomyces sp. WAC05374]|uniref:MOSC domain-containing protein n=1 Tax=Streptomyces sp. WAC05374 TaxID=2487420 RepID=UPI000F87B845|nr:MOSC N-terminal beta barrel domain-containing protein [Streptomyces sp. WAC05374]RST17560.1 MOSC domain-containing protein [Streptomyces sp. WAC05374]TDF50188.1 MOSC domain-containing protein [Streptomyces sp. WAC05374]TDF57913.1 MOSC domain-containing protein [Streptomyces sp. WAC05374]TDF60442.1 MOSC domain-containing protein [Streptomyces sp. WAC05374]
MTDVVGVIERIWRYPVKSTGGESLQRVDVDARGLLGDRLFAVRDAGGKFGSGKNTRRFRRMPGLLHLRSRYADGIDRPELLDPRGTAVPDPSAYLRGYLGRDDVAVVREGATSHVDQLPVSVLTTATLDWVRSAVPTVPVDERRFRPNLLVRTPPGTRPFVEDEWFGSTARIGESVHVEFVRSSERCVMVNEAQGDLPHSPLVLRAIAGAHGTRLDALATVAAPGLVRVGDGIVLL